MPIRRYADMKRFLGNIKEGMKDIKYIGTLAEENFASVLQKHGYKIVEKDKHGYDFETTKFNPNTGKDKTEYWEIKVDGSPISKIQKEFRASHHDYHEIRYKTVIGGVRRMTALPDEDSDSLESFGLEQRRNADEWGFPKW